MDLTKIRGWIHRGQQAMRALLPRRERYRPERHYMRGPGPRSQKKNAAGKAVPLPNKGRGKSNSRA